MVRIGVATSEPNRRARFPARPGRGNVLPSRDTTTTLPRISASRPFSKLSTRAFASPGRAGTRWQMSASFSATHHAQLLTAYNESLDKIIEFGTKWQSTQGLNLDTEIEDLKTQLQAIWDQEG